MGAVANTITGLFSRSATTDEKPIDEQKDDDEIWYEAEDGEALELHHNLKEPVPDCYSDKPCEMPANFPWVNTPKWGRMEVQEAEAELKEGMGQTVVRRTARRGRRSGNEAGRRVDKMSTDKGGRAGERRK